MVNAETVTDTAFWLSRRTA